MLFKIIIFKKILISALLLSASILAILGSFRYVWGVRQLDSSSSSLRDAIWGKWLLLGVLITSLPFELWEIRESYLIIKLSY